MAHLVRSRHVVEAELLDAITRRRHAADQLDLESYGHLAEHVDDLLDELHEQLHVGDDA